MKIDETSMEIIKHLRDGRKPFKKIAQKMSLAENTVRSRVVKLIDKGVLEISGAIDPQAVPGHKIVIVGVNLQSMELVRKGEEISKIKGVVSVQVVTGRYDLLVTVLLNEEFNLIEFFTEEMTKIDGIRSFETFVVYKGYNAKVPYIL